MAEKTRNRKAALSMVSALRYFLKGNMLFAFNGIIVLAINSIVNIFPSLFQQVYTDNIITQKNPEWFTPLIVLYILLFVLELVVWIGFSILRRKSQARVNITTSSNFLWTVFRLPMTLLTQFSPGELAARYTTIAKTSRLIDYSLAAVSLLILPILCCYFVMLGAEINEMLRGLSRWARPECHFSGLMCFPSLVTKVYKMPYGVSLVISPFNFPILLCTVYECPREHLHQ